MEKREFEERYRLVYKDMYRFALYVLGRSADAEDAVSEAVMDAFAGRKGLRDPEAFRAWIFKILSVKCKRKLKEYTHKMLELDEQILDHTSENEWSVEEAQDIRNAFFSLKEQERIIISMSVFGGYNSKEIGRELYIKDATIRSKLSRAFGKMQKQLEA